MKNSSMSLLLMISILAGAAAATNETSWYNTVPRGKRNVTTFHFYVHDVRGGPNATLYGVASASVTATSSTGFGQINVFDDLVTADPNITSPEVARAQGTTTSADLRVRAVAMNMNFFITAGEFNGSVISVIGRNQVGLAVRELTVAGGAGAFRYARGYAVTRSYSNDAATNYSVLEYTVYVTTSKFSKF